MKALTPLALLLLTAPLAAQQQIAPYGQPKSPLPGVTSGSQTGTTHSASTFEGFQAYLFGSALAEQMGVLFLDDTTIVSSGQGPNLVEDGVTYSCTYNSLQWNEDTYFGLTSKTFLANGNDGTVSMTYDSPQSTVSFDLMTFDGYPDTATVNVYHLGGALLYTSPPIGLTDSTPVPFSYSDTDIGSISITGVYPWSPVIDNHEFEAGGFEIIIVGNCGGNMTLRANDATPGGQIGVIYSFGMGSYVIPGGPCAGTVLGLDGAGITLAAVLTADAGGFASYTAFVPPGACGNVYVQAIDVSTCATSTVIGL